MPTPSTNTRPSLARRVTPKDRQKRAEAVAGEGVAITVDGVKYVVREGDLSAADVAAMRREVGLSFMGVLKAAKADPDVDIIAAVVWLARRVEGERDLTFVEVAETIGYDSEIEAVSEGDEPESGSSPEA